MYPQRKIRREAKEGKNEDMMTEGFQDFEINLSEDEDGELRQKFDYDEDQLQDELDEDDDEESMRAPVAAVSVGEGGVQTSRHPVPNYGR